MIIRTIRINVEVSSPLNFAKAGMDMEHLIAGNDLECFLKPLLFVHVTGCLLADRGGQVSRSQGGLST